MAVRNGGGEQNGGPGVCRKEGAGRAPLGRAITRRKKREKWRVA